MDTAPDSRFSRGFDPTKFTTAPLRIERTKRFEAPADQVFAKIVDHQAMVGWVPMLTAVRLEHGGSTAPGDCGVGTVRHCSVQGMGNVDETIIHWDPPRSWAYKVSAKGMPTKDHVATMAVQPDGAGGTVLVWRHYFNYKGFVVRWMFPFMFKAMLGRALENLRKELSMKAPGGRRTA